MPAGGEVTSPEDIVTGGIGETPAAFGVPSDTQVCDAYVFLTDSDPNGIAVRALPDKSALIIATLPGAIPDNPDSLGAEAHVVGSKNGWFLIENAVHPAEAYGVGETEPAPGAGSDVVRKAYAGRHWVHGSRLATFIQSGTALRAEAAPASTPVFDLGLTDETYVTVTGVSNCQGEALELSVKRSDGKTGSGWIGGDDHARLCANQVTTCG